MATFNLSNAAKIYANGYDLTSYFNSVGIEKEADTVEVTSLADSSKSYIAGLHDATISGEGMFDRSAAASDVVLQAALGVENSEINYLPQGDALGDYGYGIDAEETKYGVESPVDGVVAISMEAQSSSGGERIVSMHALEARSSAGTATTVDNAEFSSVGAVGYLQVTGLTGGTAVIKLQDSEDDVTYVDLITFTDVTAANTSQRLTVAGSVSRYARALYTPTGGTVTFFAGLGRTPNLNPS